MNTEQTPRQEFWDRLKWGLQVGAAFTILFALIFGLLSLLITIHHLAAHALLLGSIFGTAIYFGARHNQQKERLERRRREEL